MLAVTMPVAVAMVLAQAPDLSGMVWALIGGIVGGTLGFMTALVTFQVRLNKIETNVEDACRVAKAAQKCADDAGREAEYVHRRQNVIIPTLMDVCDKANVKNRQTDVLARFLLTVESAEMPKI